MKNLDTLESELHDHWKKWRDVPLIGQNFDRAAVCKAVKIFYEGEGLPAPILVWDECSWPSGSVGDRDNSSEKGRTCLTPDHRSVMLVELHPHRR